MNTRLILLALLAVALACPAWAGQGETKQEIIGSIKNVKGQAEVVRNETTLPAKPGLKLYAKDRIITGPDSSLGVILRDDTVISLGPDSDFAVKEFAFKPEDGNLSLVTKLLKGTAAYLSGSISKLKPGAAKLETPVATIGIRGTRFLAKVERPGR